MKEDLNALLYQRYVTEASRIGMEDMMGIDAFREKTGAIFAGMRFMTLNEAAEEKGFLYYTVREENDLRVCDVPVFGYYAPSEKAAVRLFSRLADEVLRSGSALFQIHLYTHDVPSLKRFSMMQFGYMAEKGLFRIPGNVRAGGHSCTIRMLHKEEIEDRWTEIWELVSSLIRHLQQAPVFYPGEEFTEQAYKAFFLDEETTLFSALSPEDRIVGIIETNAETTWFTGETSKAVNVGEVYVIPPYRGSGLANDLLMTAAEHEKKNGAVYLWVEHGTANPNAVGFWNKYFSAYQYELVRKIIV